MTYPMTYPADAADPDASDLSGASCPRLTGSHEVARRLAELDDRYIRDNFIPLDELADTHPDTSSGGVRGDVAAGRMPQPAYRLDDGTDMVAPDYFALVDAADSVDALPDWFEAAYARAAARFGVAKDADAIRDQWESYLSGGYQVCLRQVTPDKIAEKAHWVSMIEGLLEATGAILDPPRWGGPMSPQWYGTYLRSRYPQAF